MKNNPGASFADFKAIANEEWSDSITCRKKLKLIG
jgi:hypothetical protein